MTEHIIKRIDDLQKTLEKHFELQIQSDKELTKISILMESHLKDSEKYREMREEKEEKTDKTLQILRDAIGTGKTAMFLGGIIITVGSAVLMVQKFFK